MRDAVLAHRPDGEDLVFTGHLEKSDAGPGAGTAVVAELVDGRAWDAVSHGFYDVVPEQIAAFCRSHWGERSVENLLFRADGTVVGGACAVVRSVPFTKTGIAIVKWGPVWQKAGVDLSGKQLSSILISLKEEYCQRRNFHLTVMPPPHPVTQDLSDQALEEAGFKRGKMLRAPERYFVNTALSAEELLASVNQKWRYNLKKARGNELQIKFADSADGLEAFLALYRQMLERKQFADYSAISALPGMMNSQSETTRPKVVLVYHQGRPTAGGVFWIGGETAFYMFSATDHRALGLKAGYALHWWFAERLCQMNRVSWYDLGGNDLDPGLHQFKKGFVGKLGQIVTSLPSRHYTPSTLAGLVGSSAFVVRDARRACIRAVNRLKPAAAK